MMFSSNQEAACPACNHQAKVRDFAENRHVPALIDAARRFYNLSEKAWAGVSDEARQELFDGFVEAKREMAAALQARRVLIVVRGGVADYVADSGIEVEIFDFDNYKDDPAGTDPVPVLFADLAKGAGVPVKGGV